MNSGWLVRGLLALWVMTLSSTTEGYELITHAQISQRAFAASNRAEASTALTRRFQITETLRDWLGARAIRDEDHQRHRRDSLGRQQI